MADAGAGRGLAVEAAALAAAAPPVAGARPAAWTRVSARVTWTRAAAAAPPLPAGAALVLPVAAPGVPAARSPPAAWTRRRLSARLVPVLAVALFLLGSADAGLGLFSFSIILPPGKACPPMDADVANLHTATQYLIMGVTMQVVAFTMALLVPPAWDLAVGGTVLGVITAYYFPAYDVLWLLAAACDDGAPAIQFWVVYVVLWPAFAIGAAVSLRSTVESDDHYYVPV